MTLKETIQALIKDQIKIQVFVGKVISVNENEMTCDVDLQNSPNLFDVRLRAVIDNNEKGILIVPKINSYVLVGLIDNNIQSSFVCGYTEIDKYRLLIDEIVLSGDSFGGLVKVEELTQKLNDIESAVNQLTASFNSHTHTSPPAPTNPVVTTPPLIGSNISLTPTNSSELENNKVKHG